MKKRKVILLVILAVLLIGIIVGVAVYVNKPPKESKWNVRIWVEGVSKSEVVLHVERNDESIDAPELMTGYAFALERWTSIGWIPVNMREGVAFDSVGVPIGKTYSNKWEIELDFYYEDLPVGFYRISKSMSLYEDYNVRETYYAPFVHLPWWKFLLALAFIAILICMIWHRKSVFEKNKFAANIKLTWDWIKMRSAMKKKFMIIVFSVFIIILGIFIYKSVEKDHDDWGIRLKVQDVSATEVRLSAERDSDESNGKIIVGDSYGLDKWTLQGWTSLVKDQSTARKRHKIPVESSKQWKVDWESEVGSLQSGVYRITKRVAKSSGVKEGKLPTELEEKTLAVSFCVISKELKMAAGIVIGLFVVAIYLWRHREVLHIIGQWFKVGKRLKIILYASLCIFLFVAGVVLYSHIRWANDELGIRMKITSLPIREGVVGYKIQRNDNEIPYRMYTTNKEEVDKWTITGWENVISRSKIESTTMYELKEPESEMEDTVRLYYFEKRFPIGLYRVRQTVMVEEAIQKEMIYSAPFLLIGWWEILVYIALGVGIGFAVWKVRKDNIRIWKIIRWKKLLIWCVVILGVLLVISPFIFYYYERDVAEYMWESGTRITDAQAEYLQIYHCSYKGAVDKGIKEVDPTLTSIVLTDEQRNVIKNILKEKVLIPYPKLWYRYDAVITYGNVVEFQLDLENGIIYWNGGYVGYSRSRINPQEVRGYVKLFENETNALKDILNVQ